MIPRRRAQPAGAVQAPAACLLRVHGARRQLVTFPAAAVLRPHVKSPGWQLATWPATGRHPDLPPRASAAGPATACAPAPEQARQGHPALARREGIGRPASPTAEARRTGLNHSGFRTNFKNKYHSQLQCGLCCKSSAIRNCRLARAGRPLSLE